MGKEKDKETGLYYFGARYMEPRIGRFAVIDPVGPVSSQTGKANEKLLLNPQKLNRYAYSINNPYRYKDEDGRWPEEVHNSIIKAAFPKLPRSAIIAMQRGSAYVDKFQEPQYSYMHAMRAPGQSVEEAERLMNNFIRQKVREYKTLMSQGKTGAAYEALGMATHPITDATSPSHEGMQTWNSPWTHPLEAWEHRKKESVEIFNANPTYLQKSIDSLRNFYDANK